MNKRTHVNSKAWYIVNLLICVRKYHHVSDPNVNSSAHPTASQNFCANLGRYLGLISCSTELSVSPKCCLHFPDSHDLRWGTQATFPWIPTIHSPSENECISMYSKCLQMILRNGKKFPSQISRADNLKCKARLSSSEDPWLFHQL